MTRCASITRWANVTGCTRVSGRTWITGCASRARWANVTGCTRVAGRSDLRLHDLRDSHNGRRHRRHIAKPWDTFQDGIAIGGLGHQFESSARSKCVHKVPGRNRLFIRIFQSDLRCRIGNIGSIISVPDVQGFIRSGCLLLQRKLNIVNAGIVKLNDGTCRTLQRNTIGQ